MTIAGLRERGKALLQGLPRDALVVGILVLSSSASFGLGVLAGRDAGQGSGFSITELPLASTTLPAAAAGVLPAGTSPAPAQLPAGGQVVAAKSGTKYYLPWCAGAARIADANKVWFASADDAEAAGYAPAANCPGL
ncbi:MAG: hypothetical protein KGI41_04335 [Patescibacteria group bacterium]|nr:hypothetical protein [Patescibacteria group bacterium]MDE1966438.1 hypothetical protein [Patescibacteria group bacterium]